MTYDPVSLSAAIGNFHSREHNYGRVKFIAEHFKIPRSTLYRKSKEFISEFCNNCGRPAKQSNTSVKELKSRAEESDARIRELEKELEYLKAGNRQIIRRLTFLLIAIGVSGRTLAWILNLCFGIKVSHSTILNQAQQYGEKATGIMRSHFTEHGINAAIDEIYISGKALFLAVAPSSLLICNSAVYEGATEENWNHFLNMMHNLKGTVSDRGAGILAAVTKIRGHKHQSDVFHCMYNVLKELRKLESRSYSLIRSEEKAEDKLNKKRKRGRDTRSEAASLRAVKNRCRAAVALFDSMREAVELAFNAMLISDGFTITRKDKARETLDFVCEWISDINPEWTKVISAFKDEYLLEYLDAIYEKVSRIDVQAKTPLDNEYIFSTLIYYWEKQAARRWRGKEVIFPADIEERLNSMCSNYKQVKDDLFKCLDGTTKASSSVECINSKIGFFRYDKKYFNNEYANLISVVHNLTPFLNGKRKGYSPAKLAGCSLAEKNIFEIFGI